MVRRGTGAVVEAAKLGLAASSSGQSAESGASSEPPESGASGKWLLLIYRIPSEPSRLRAAVWRRLKGLGAVYLQNSAAVLPASTSADRAMRRLRHDILEMSGTAVLMSCEALAGEADVLAAFLTARNDEYEEIVDKCGDFLAGIEKEFAAAHFSFAELEENEVDHQKLVNWLAKVVARDAFGAPGRQAADDAVARCAQELERYAARVYTEETDER